MKAVILAGGLGTRLAEETALKPKPMVQIGDKPILWHIMKIYSAHGVNDFIVCCGYRGYLIKEFFSNYAMHTSDVTFSLKENRVAFRNCEAEPWTVTLVDTGQDTMTGGRLKRVASYVEGEEAFCFTYGDGVSDIDISKLIDFHKDHGKLATLTAIQPPGRFGALVTDGSKIKSFSEKPKGDGSWINGGFFVLSPKVIELIDGDGTVWEGGPMETLARMGEFEAFRHHGFWHPMDTLRDRQHLTQLWASGSPPWKTWS